MDLHSLSQATGLAPGMIVYLGCMLATWPISLGYRACPRGFAREAYAICVGMVLCALSYGGMGLANLCITPTVTYTLCLFVPRQYLGLVVALLSFAHLIQNHVANASGTAWSEGKIDFTGSQMIITLKCVAFAFNLQDGHKLPKHFDKGETSQKLSTHQLASLLTALPRPTSFLAFMADPSTVLIGPFLEYREFDEFIQGTGVHAEKNKPSCIGTLMSSVAATIVLAVAHTMLAGQFPITVFTDADWATHATWYKLALVYVVPLQARLKYYFCWTLSHTALIFAGTAYKGASAAPGYTWSRGQNVHPLAIELATSAVEYPLHWNICTGNWLRHYVYDRQQPLGKKPGFRALLVTQTVSGIWHGLYAGYWLFFLGSAFMLQNSRFLFKMVAAAPKGMQPLLNFVHGFASKVQLNYLAVAFLVLDLHLVLGVWRDLWWYGHACTGLVFLVSLFVKPPKPLKSI